MPETEFTTALDARLRTSVGVGVSVSEIFGPTPGRPTLNYRVSYVPGSGNSRFQAVVVDLDIWTGGPDPSAAENIAAAVEAALLDWRVETERQGVVRLRSLARATEPETDEKLAHITLRLTGRCFRRL